MSKHRITVDMKYSGQPGSYQDSLVLASVAFEHQGLEGYKNPDAPFVPWTSLSEEMVKRTLPHVYAGFPLDPDGKKCWADTRLDYLKYIGEGVWEFQARTPFTD